MEKVKVKIVRETDLAKNEGFYLVSVNGRHIRAMSFNLDVVKGNEYDEDKVKQKAFALAKLIEVKGHAKSEETIYETPEEKTIPTREEVESTETI